MLQTLRLDAVPILREWGASRKPGWVLWMRLVFLTPGFQLVIALRVQRLAGKVPIAGAITRRMIWYWATQRFSCDIDSQAIIGPGFHIPHPVGIVIGGGVKIGTSVTVLQNVTLGRGRREIADSPKIGDNVEIGCGACVLGPINVGDGAIIGANSVVLKDVPAGAVAVGSPARVLWRGQDESAVA